jgi:drug/metabolite transporter (DMT)-like permease
MNKTLGIILIVIGLIGVVWGGFSFTTSKKIVDLGPIQASRTKTHEVPIAPIAGAILLVGGVVLVASGKQ